MPTAPIKPGTTCFSSGWGWMDDSEFVPNVLQAVRLKTISTEECKLVNEKYYDDGTNFFFNGSQVCTEGGIKQPCNGDSGGPLICEGK